MKRLFAIALALAFAMGLVMAQGGPDDQYVRIYNLIQLGDSLAASGQSNQALEKYQEAQAALQRIQQYDPTWNPRVVNFRLSYLAEKISGLATTTRPAAPASAASQPPPTAPTATIPAEVQQELAALREQVAALQSTKLTLEAKLKEALATQPAAVDPRELAKAEQRVQALAKENELLKATLAQQPAKAAGAGDKALEESRAALADANRKLTEQNALSQRLAAEKDALQSRVTSLLASAEAMEAIRDENELLKRQLAEAKKNQSGRGDVARQLAEAQARIATLQSDAEVLRLEKIALQNRIRSMSNAAPVVATVQPPEVKSVSAAERKEDLDRIKTLEAEREDLRKKLESANRALYGTRNASLQVQIEELNSQIFNLRARLEVFEARAVPFTEEELALFRKTPTVLAAPDPHAGKRPVRELPAGSASLVAEAQRAFANKDYAQAEDKYLQILKKDEKNNHTLANLAAIQLEQGKLAEAEQNVRKAMASAPDDPRTLSLFGIVKFRQRNYDEALEALARAAKLDPQNAEIQNYLGVTLGHKGLRGPAETALRTAIRIQPAYGEAHNNLAVIYLSQKPPAVELARWHYQKARAAGHPQNPELEQQLEKKEGAANLP